MSDKPDDFDRVCAAFDDAVEPVLDRSETRRGMLAALREMGRLPPRGTGNALAEAGIERPTLAEAWCYSCAELIRQGEQQGPGAD